MKKTNTNYEYKDIENQLFTNIENISYSNYDNKYIQDDVNITSAVFWGVRTTPNSLSGILIFISSHLQMSSINKH